MNSYTLKSVWLVAQGEYSDYRVIAAFSSEEKAVAYVEKYNRLCGSSYDQAMVDGEMEIDPSLDNITEVTYVKVIMNEEGNSKTEGPFTVSPEIGFVPISCFEERLDFSQRKLSDKHTGIFDLVSIVRTDNVQRAVKVTNERRTRLIANGLWGNNIAHIEEEK